MGSLGRFRRIAKEWVAAGLGVAALAVAAAVYYHSDRTTYRLTITAGSRDGLRHQFAEHLASVAAHNRVQLRVVGTSGSEEALDRVNLDRENPQAIDLALVQGGLDARGRERVREVSALKIEPLHLLAKGEIDTGRGTAPGLEFLRGHTINLSEVGSGTYELAREVLAFAGLKPASSGQAGDYTVKTLSYHALITEPDRAKLPDAVFTVSALPSPVVKHLVSTRDYRLVPLRFGEAFALDALHTVAGQDFPDGPRSVDGVDRVHVYNTAIPAYTYSVAPPIPPEPVPTFGTRLLLVAHEDTNTEAVSRLLEAAFVNGPGGPALEPGLLELPSELKWHDGTLVYRERTKPLAMGDAIDVLEKSASLSAIVLGGVFCLWQWYRQRRRRCRDLGFEAYMVKVTAIEKRALEIELGAVIDVKELLTLQLDLSRLKNEALQRFTSGEIEGEELISGFVSHVNDARNYLTRLILHERENIEERAAAEQRSAGSLWAEAVGDLDLDRSPAAETAGETAGT
jgi:TRAP-type uncharacterized transport system substrate-binding protein